MGILWPIRWLGGVEYEEKRLLLAMIVVILGSVGASSIETIAAVVDSPTQARQKDEKKKN